MEMETKHIRVSIKAREYLMINKAKTMQTPAEKIDELLFGVSHGEDDLSRDVTTPEVAEEKARGIR